MTFGFEPKTAGFGGPYPYHWGFVTIRAITGY